MNTIEIANLKNIEKLTFEMPSKGVYILCGRNGSGKTSLLACLLRIGKSNAFPLFFRSSTLSKSLDQFDKAKISYSVNSETVDYRYAGQRWVPLPRAKASVLGKFGFPEVYFFGANAKRIEPQADDIESNKFTDAPSTVKSEISKILSDSRFDNLKYVASKTNSLKAYLLPSYKDLKTKKQHYFTERNFSLGELCVLKLVLELEKCRNNSLVLIDELELALHPTAQIRLFEYITDISSKKQLTIIFSSHSVSLVKHAKQNQLLLLKKIGSEITCMKNPYPAEVIGELAFQNENPIEKIFCVEDTAAKHCLEELIKNILNEEFKDKSSPSTVVVPFGPFNAVIDFISNSSSIIRAPSVCHAVLDQDVCSETVEGWKTSNNYTFLQKHKVIENKLHYFPWTPEVGVSEFFSATNNNAAAKLKTYLQNGTIDFNQIQWNSLDSLTGAAKRKKAKILVREGIDIIASSRSTSFELAEATLYQFFANNYYITNKGQIKNLLLPLLR